MVDSITHAEPVMPRHQRRDMAGSKIDSGQLPNQGPSLGKNVGPLNWFSCWRFSNIANHSRIRVAITSIAAVDGASTV